MFKNYLKIAFRNIIRQKGYSFINIFGLAVGMAVCIMILLWVRHESSFDGFHSEADNLYRVNSIWRKGDVKHQAVTAAPLAPSLKKEFPEIVDVVRFYNTQTWLMRYGRTAGYEENGYFADPSIFTVFSFPLVKGDPKTALSNPRSIVLTESLATKYFSSENPIGKTILVDNQYDFSVTGVMKNIPTNSHLHFDFLVPCTLVGKKGTMNWLAQETLVSWHNADFYTYVQLGQNTSGEAVSRKISGYMKKTVPGSVTSLYLQPLKDIHLHSSHLIGNPPGSGNIAYIYLFSAMAFIVLLIACINFMNLTTARAGNRAKEIGMRKVVGARRANIINQFFGESVILAFIALIFAVILVELFLPAFNQLSNRPLVLDLSENLLVLAGLAGIALFTGIVSGSYPALFLSSFQPGKVLKGPLKSGAKGFLLRKALVIVQFSLTVIFIIGALVIYKQLAYVQDKPLGFDKEHLIYTSIPGEFREGYATFKNELLRNSSIVNVTASVSLPSFGRDINTEDVDWDGKAPGRELLIRGVGTDYDFIETFKMEMKEGRTFSREFSTDPANYILNETAVKAMGIDSPVGKRLTLMGNTGTIIGVVKDYHFRSLHTPVAPLVLRLYQPRWLNFMFVRVKPGDISDVIKILESKWNDFAPGHPFEYRFTDDNLAGLYIAEQRIRAMFNYFTLLAVCIACLGLFGLAAFTAEQRTKEIGIRKVLGDSVSGIVVMLSKEFMFWVVLSNIIAWPVAYVVMTGWLRNFAYRAPISIFIFVTAGVMALVIAWLTVGYQSVKAALANPIEALRYE
jgi:ABC-type antimicrobial peptide transport system permease subunit